MIRVDRLLEGNDTLYGVNPREVASDLEAKLNELETNNDITDVFALPDYHNMDKDGGTKDIFILTTEKDPESIVHRWHTAILRGEATMHGWATPKIHSLLEERLAELAGFEVKHVVAITDHHDWAIASGFGGEDGLKDMILCYHPKDHLPQV